MNDSARERGLTSTADIGKWTPEEAEAYEMAHDLITALIAAYSARLHIMPEGGKREDLLRQQRESSQLRWALTVFDHEDIRRVLDGYPSRIRQVRGAIE